jgi:hypothetical protein
LLADIKARHIQQEIKAMKGAIILAAIVAVALGACRREVEHTPMKLGADMPAATEVAR